MRDRRVGGRGEDGRARRTRTPAWRRTPSTRCRCGRGTASTYSDWSASGTARTHSGATTVYFGASTYTAVEGGAAARVTVRLNRAHGAAVTIPLTTTHQGGAGADDYSGIPASVAFGASQTSASFDVLALADDRDESGERVRIGFGTLPGDIDAGQPVDGDGRAARRQRGVGGARDLPGRRAAGRDRGRERRARATESDRGRLGDPAGRARPGRDGAADGGLPRRRHGGRPPVRAGRR